MAGHQAQKQKRRFIRGSAILLSPLLSIGPVSICLNKNLQDEFSIMSFLKELVSENKSCSLVASDLKRMCRNNYQGTVRFFERHVSFNGF